MDKPKIVIPESKDEILKQVEALEYLIERDTSQKDKKVHEEALSELKLKLNKFK